MRCTPAKANAFKSTDPLAASIVGPPGTCEYVGTSEQSPTFPDTLNGRATYTCASTGGKKTVTFTWALSGN